MFLNLKKNRMKNIDLKVHSILRNLNLGVCGHPKRAKLQKYTQIFTDFEFIFTYYKNISTRPNASKFL